MVEAPGIELDALLVQAFDACEKLDQISAEAVDGPAQRHVEPLHGSVGHEPPVRRSVLEG
jgi:hypothetical protein